MHIAEYCSVFYYYCLICNYCHKVDQEPNVVACFQHGRLCVAIDKSLTIFNEICDEILCSINFPSTIVCYCMSKDGFFLFVILKNRILYCLHLPDGKIIFTK